MPGRLLVIVLGALWAVIEGDIEPIYQLTTTHPLIFYRSVVGLIDGVFLRIIEELMKVLIYLRSEYFRQLLNPAIQTKSGGMDTLHVCHTY